MSDRQLRANARALRRQMTAAETRLWYHLRARRFCRARFTRQKPVGRYIVDFACTEHALIIELDGGQHAEQAAYDQRRDAWLQAQGYMVLRFWNNEVMQELPGVLQRIAEALHRRPSPPAPLPQAGEGSEWHSPLPQAGEGSEQNSPLPPAGEGGRRPGEGGSLAMA